MSTSNFSHQHSVTLVQDEVLDVREVQHFPAGGQVHNSARRAHDDVRHLHLQRIDVQLHVHA